MTGSDVIADFRYALRKARDDGEINCDDTLRDLEERQAA
jgi:hypothetical protein